MVFYGGTMSTGSAQKRSNGVAFLVVGAIVLAIGLAGIARWIYLAGQSSAGNASGASGVLQSLTDIGSALCVGAGLVLLTLGLIQRRNAARAKRTDG